MLYRDMNSLNRVEYKSEAIKSGGWFPRDSYFVLIVIKLSSLSLDFAFTNKLYAGKGILVVLDFVSVFLVKGIKFSCFDKKRVFFNLLKYKKAYLPLNFFKLENGEGS